jgi:hypothetical protein
MVSNTQTASHERLERGSTLPVRGCYVRIFHTPSPVQGTRINGQGGRAGPASGLPNDRIPSGGPTRSTHSVSSEAVPTAERGHVSANHNSELTDLKMPVGMARPANADRRFGALVVNGPSVVCATPTGFSKSLRAAGTLNRRERDEKHAAETYYVTGDCAETSKRSA